MIPIAFTLKVAGRDYSSEASTAWSTEKVHGLLHFDGRELMVEWAGTSSIDEVSGLEVHSETESVAPEELSVPLGRIRTARLAGGWWRPRLEMTGNDLQVFIRIPGAAAGRVLFWLNRRDRSRAAGFVNALHQAARQAQAPGARVLPNLPLDSTPPEGSA